MAQNHALCMCHRYCRLHSIKLYLCVRFHGDFGTRPSIQQLDDLRAFSGHPASHPAGPRQRGPPAPSRWPCTHSQLGSLVPLLHLPPLPAPSSLASGTLPPSSQLSSAGMDGGGVHGSERRGGRQPVPASRQRHCGCRPTPRHRRCHCPLGRALLWRRQREADSAPPFLRAASAAPPRPPAGTISTGTTGWIRIQIE